MGRAKLARAGGAVQTRRYFDFTSPENPAKASSPSPKPATIWLYSKILPTSPSP
jgi:hypothetical protein